MTVEPGFELLKSLFDMPYPFPRLNSLSNRELVSLTNCSPSDFEDQYPDFQYDEDRWEAFMDDVQVICYLRFIHAVEEGKL